MILSPCPSLGLSLPIFTWKILIGQDDLEVLDELLCILRPQRGA